MKHYSGLDFAVLLSWVCFLQLYQCLPLQSFSQGPFRPPPPLHYHGPPLNRPPPPGPGISIPNGNPPPYRRPNVKPQSVPQFGNYIPNNESPPQVQYPPDVRGRSKVHPKSIQRFQKYFPGPPICKCEYPENPLKLGPRPKPKPIRLVQPSPEQTGSVQRSPGDPGSSPQNSLQKEELSIQETNDMLLNYYENAFVHGPNEPAHQQNVVEFEHRNNKRPTGNCPTELNREIEGKKFLVTELSSNCSAMSRMNAIDFCKVLGLQAVTFDTDKTVEEKNAIMELAQNLGLNSFWTSGFVSHPTSDNVIQTLTWSSATMLSTEDVEPGTGFWSQSGEGGGPQPDNYEFIKDPIEENRENCVAVLNDAYGDGIKFHDRPCKDVHHALCEEPKMSMDDLLGFESIYSNIFIERR